MSGNNHLIRDEGDTVRFTVTFYNATGALANPTTVTWAQRTPAQAETANTTTTSGVTNVSTGVYYKDVLLSTAGLWRTEFRGVGNSVDQTERYSIDVIRSELRV
jgi:hypothetical protein